MTVRMDILLKYFPLLSPRQKDQYLQLNQGIAYWNRRINLVSRKDIDHLPLRHILHSLSIAVHTRFSPSDTVLDVGTGGGFPGLPLAIMFPETRFTLIDSIGKKIRAVKEISRSLDLANVQCLQVRAEDYHGKTRFVVSRAVASLDRFTGWVCKNLEEDAEAGPAQQKTLQQFRPQGSGIWYLKGGELEEELNPFPGARAFELRDVFSEAFFENKKLVWLPRNSLF